MSAARIAAVIGAAVISVTAGPAVGAFATGPARPGATAARVRPAVPGAPGTMAGECQRMMRAYPDMARMHEQMMNGSRGMGRMNRADAGRRGRRNDGRGFRWHAGSGRPVTVLP